MKVIVYPCIPKKKKNLSHTCANRKDVGLYITRTHPYLQTIKVLQCCRLFLKQCVVGTCIYQIRLKEAISIHNCQLQLLNMFNTMFDYLVSWS